MSEKPKQAEGDHSTKEQASRCEDIVPDRISSKGAQEGFQKAFAIAHENDVSPSSPLILTIRPGETEAEYQARLQSVQANRFTITDDAVSMNTGNALPRPERPLDQAPNLEFMDGFVAGVKEGHHMTVENAGVSKGFAKAIHEGLRTVPEAITRELEEHGVKVYAFKDIHAYDKRFGTHKASEPESLNGASLHDTSSHPPRIAVFEFLGDGQPVSDLPDTNSPGLVRHEIGHAHSFLHGYLTVKDKNFQKAFVEDLKHIKPTEMQQLQKEVGSAENKGHLWHYLNGKSKEEVYAELFAMATGGASDKIAAERLRHYFPETVQYVRQESNK